VLCSRLFYAPYIDSLLASPERQRTRNLTSRGVRGWLDTTSKCTVTRGGGIQGRATTVAGHPCRTSIYQISDPGMLSTCP